MRQEDVAARCAEGRAEAAGWCDFLSPSHTPELSWGLVEDGCVQRQAALCRAPQKHHERWISA